jgi:CRP/FNR family transcriptional regulator, cyclic AMP receptor protein
LIERFSDQATLLEALLNQKLVRGNESLARDLSQRIELCAVEAGQILIQQGGDDNDLYFLLAGRYEIVVNGRKIAIRGPGEHVGEMAAILPSLRRSATVQSSESGVVARLNSIGLIEFANRYPSMWQHLAGVLAERLFQRNSLVTATHHEIEVFIISSAEALPVARAVQEALAHDPFKVTLWTDGVFRASQYSIESLVQKLDTSDFAVAIAQPDDLTQTRGAAQPTPRDNVLFELGLFIGRLGRLRSFLLEPARAGVKLPSDLTGITTIPYKPGPEAELLALMGPACNQLRRLFKEIGPYN